MLARENATMKRFPEVPNGMGMGSPVCKYLLISIHVSRWQSELYVLLLERYVDTCVNRVAKCTRGSLFTAEYGIKVARYEFCFLHCWCEKIRVLYAATNGSVLKSLHHTKLYQVVFAPITLG